MLATGSGGLAVQSQRGEDQVPAAGLRVRGSHQRSLTLSHSHSQWAGRKGRARVYTARAAPRKKRMPAKMVESQAAPAGVGSGDGAGAVSAGTYPRGAGW